MTKIKNQTTGDWEDVANLSASDSIRNPDWSRAVDLTAFAFSTGYTVPEDGIIVVARLRPVAVGSTLTMTINDVPFIVVKGGTGTNADTNSNSCAPVAQGDFIKVSETREGDTIHFVPYKVDAVDNRFPTNYTTSEQFTGKYWIDGKKIYRKVFTGPYVQIAGASWVNLSWADCSSLNVDTCIEIHAIGKDSAANYPKAVDNKLWAISSAGLVSAAPQNNNFSVNVVIVEYTKTTD